MLAPRIDILAIQGPVSGVEALRELQVVRRSRHIVTPLTVVATLFVLTAACEQGWALSEARGEGMALAQPVPQWSPGGSLIAFSQVGGIYVVRQDGSELRLLAGGPSSDTYNVAQSPSISPDGSRIAYTAFKHDSWRPFDREYRWDIVTSALDGSNKRRLTRGDNLITMNVSPAWSPDGKRIAFMSNRLHGERIVKEMTLYTMAADGSDVRSMAPAMVTRGTTPVWFPDGRKLAFLGSGRDSESGKYTEEALYVVGADGSGLERLAEAVISPAWSPDGGRIAFVGEDVGDDGLYMRVVFVMDLNGSSTTEVIRSNDFPLGEVSWSPDGTKILLGSGRSVSIVNVDGSDHRYLMTIRTGGVRVRELHASWSGDGSRIAVHVPLVATDFWDSYGSNLAEDVPYFDVALFTMNADGTDKRVLVTFRPEPDAPDSRDNRRGLVEAAHGRPFPAQYEVSPVSLVPPSSTVTPQPWHDGDRLMVRIRTR